MTGNKVVVVIPCYNDTAFLMDAVMSVKNQTHINLEIVLVDDCSDPRFYTDLESVSRLVDRFIRHEVNRGVSAARNTGISASDADFVLPLDSDDLISPTYVEECIEQYRSNPALGIVYSRAEYIGERTGSWDLPAFSMESILRENCIFCSAMYRRSDWVAVGGYDESLRLSSEDWDFWLRVLKLKRSVHRIDKVLFQYRIRSGSRNNIANRERHDGLAMMKARHPDLYPSRFLDRLKSIFSSS